MTHKRQNPSLRKLTKGTVVGIVLLTALFLILFVSNQWVAASLVVIAFGAGGYYLYSGHKIIPSENAAENAQKWDQFQQDSSNSD